MLHGVCGRGAEAVNNSIRASRRWMTSSENKDQTGESD